MFSRNFSPPTVNSCNLVTSAMNNVFGVNGSCRCRGRPVDMPLVSRVVSPFPFLLIQQIQCMVPLYDESYWISGDVDDALGRSHVHMPGSRFSSHHLPIMLVFFPLQRCEKSEGGPPCNSIACPWAAWACYPLKFPYSLVRHRKTALVMRLSK